MASSLFKLSYVNMVNKSPLVRKMNTPAMKFVETLEKIQGVNKVLYGSLTSVNTLINTLSDSDFEISSIKKMHSTNWEICEDLFKNYYLICADLVNVLSDEIDSMSEVDRMKQILENKYRMTIKNPLILKQQIYENKDYKNIVRKLLDSQHKFKALNMKRMQCTTQLTTNLQSLLQLQKGLSKASLHNPLSQYDMTHNMEHTKRIIANIRDYIALFEKAISEFESKDKYAETLRKNIHDIESAYRKANSSDPNFYITYSGIYNNEDLYYASKKIANALNLEISNLKRQISDVEDKEKYVNSHKSQLLIQNNPRVLGLAAEQTNVRNMIKQQLKDTGTIVTEISECISNDNEDLEFCVNHLKAVQEPDLKKIQNHIQYIKAQQNTMKNQNNYSKLLMLLYNAMDKAIKKEKMTELDRQSVIQRKAMADAIARQIQATQELNKHSESLQTLQAFYKKSLEKGTSSNNRELQKAINRLAETQQENMNIANSMRKLTDNYVKKSTQTRMNYEAGVDREEIREDIRKNLGSPRNFQMQMDADFSQRNNPVNKDPDTGRWGDAKQWKSIGTDIGDQLNDPRPNNLGRYKDINDNIQFKGDVYGYKTNPASNNLIGLELKDNKPVANSRPADKSKTSSQAGGSKDMYDISKLATSIRNSLNIKGGAKELDSHLKLLLKTVKDDIHSGGSKNKSKKQSGGAGVLTLISQNYSIRQYMSVVDEELRMLKNKMFNQIPAGPGAIVQQVKIELFINSKREDLVKSKLAEFSSTDDNSNFKKITNHIQQQYLMNALYSNIGAYQSIYNELDSIIGGFKLQNSIVRLVYSKVMRKVEKSDEESSDYKQLTTVNEKFGDAITILLQQVMKVNHLCRYDKIDVPKILKETQNENNKDVKDALSGADKCSTAIGYINGLVINLVRATDSLLAKMDEVQERAVVMEVRKKLQYKNLTSPVSQRLLYGKVLEMGNAIQNELKVYTAEVMKMAYAIYNNVVDSKLTNVDGNNFAEIQNTLNYVCYNNNNGKAEGRLIELIDELNKVHEDVAKDNKNILDKLQENQKSTKLDSASILTMNILIQKRTKSLEKIGIVLEGIENCLVKQRFALEDLAGINIKHTLFVTQEVNKMMIVLFATGYEIKEKIIKLNTYARLMQEQQEGRNVPSTYSELTTWVNRVAGNTVTVWAQVKEQLDSLVLAGDNNKLKTVIKVKQSGGAASTGADYALITQANTIINDKITELKRVILSDTRNITNMFNEHLDKTLSTRLIDEVLKYPNIKGQPLPTNHLLLMADTLYNGIQNGLLTDEGKEYDIDDYITHLKGIQSSNLVGGSDYASPGLTYETTDQKTQYLTSGFNKNPLNNVASLKLNKKVQSSAIVSKAKPILVRLLAVNVSALLSELVRIYSECLQVKALNLRKETANNNKESNVRNRFICEQACKKYIQEANNLLGKAINSQNKIGDAYKKTNWIASLRYKDVNEISNCIDSICKDLTDVLNEAASAVSDDKTKCYSGVLSSLTDIKKKIQLLKDVSDFDTLIKNAKECNESLKAQQKEMAKLIASNAENVYNIYKELSEADGCDKLVQKVNIHQSVQYENVNKQNLDINTTLIVKELTKILGSIVNEKDNEYNGINHNIKVKITQKNKDEYNVKFNKTLVSLIRSSGSTIGGISNYSVYNLLLNTEKMIGVCGENYVKGLSAKQQEAANANTRAAIDTTKAATDATKAATASTKAATPKPAAPPTAQSAPPTAQSAASSVSTSPAQPAASSVSTSPAQPDSEPKPVDSDDEDDSEPGDSDDEDDS